jgi:hypothetical protein
MRPDYWPRAADAGLQRQGMIGDGMWHGDCEPGTVADIAFWPAPSVVATGLGFLATELPSPWHYLVLSLDRMRSSAWVRQDLVESWDRDDDDDADSSDPDVRYLDVDDTMLDALTEASDAIVCDDDDEGGAW